MKGSSVRRSIPALVITAASLPAGAVLAAPLSSAHAAQTAKSRTFKGPVVDMRWGPVQVSIVVKHKKITNVKVAVSPHSPRSEFIQSQAIPILRSEVLKAQSASIDTVSGATDISDAYDQSLQGAIDKARQQKALN